MQETRETRAWSLGQEDPLEEGMVTLSSILFWGIPMDRGAWGLQVTGLQRVRHNWSDRACSKWRPNLCLLTLAHSLHFLVLPLPLEKLFSFSLNPTAYGILVPLPGIKPTSPALEGGILTTEPPGRSLKDFSRFKTFQNSNKVIFTLNHFVCK